VTDRPLDFDALILTGGRGRRLGGRDKAALPVAGTPMLQRALAACHGAGSVIVAGGGTVPTVAARGPVPQDMHQVQEDPPDGGPVAGIVAGLELVSSPWVLVLAVDQPDAGRAVPGLLAAAERAASGTEPPETRADASAEASPGPGASAEAPGPAAEFEDAKPADLYCHVDSGGYPQWLLGLYRTSALRAAATRVGTGHGVSVRSLTAGLAMSRVSEGGEHTGDVDTWADHAHWDARLR